MQAWSLSHERAWPPSLAPISSWDAGLAPIPIIHGLELHESVVSFVGYIDAFLELFRVAVNEFLEFCFEAKVEWVGGVLTWVVR